MPFLSECFKYFWNKQNSYSNHYNRDFQLVRFIACFMMTQSNDIQIGYKMCELASLLLNLHTTTVSLACFFRQICETNDLFKKKNKTTKNSK